jgi:hypothetical protein
MHRDVRPVSKGTICRLDAWRTDLFLTRMELYACESSVAMLCVCCASAVALSVTVSVCEII